VHTSAGRLPYRAIIHVAGINLFWRASTRSIHDSTVNAVRLADRLGLRTVAFPVIGGGTGGFDAGEAERIMRSAFAGIAGDVRVLIVRYRPAAATHGR
jgi:O-acetyl-ADP-ribose deacetylase